jgi:hypothetical protein
MLQVTDPREEFQGPRSGMVRRGQRQRGAVIMSAGGALRIASASIPASPAGPGTVRVPAAGGVR